MKRGSACCVILAMLVENCSSLIQSRTQVAKTQATGLAKWKMTVEKFVEAEFQHFTLQCSHNTYTYGTQSGGLTSSQSTDPKAMTNALRLGYRCVEIDVWPRNNEKKTLDDFLAKKEAIWTGPKGSNYPYPGNMKVIHQLKKGVIWKEMTNSADPSLFVQAILKWCEEDEADVSKKYPKLPIVISVENRAGEWGTQSDWSAREAYLAHIFNWFGERLVTPAQFTPGTKLSSLMVKMGKRKIIIKSKLTTEGNANYQNIVAMRNENEKRANLGGTYRSKSIAMAKGKKPLGTNDKKQKSVEEAVKKGFLVRTYPNMMERKSDNYAPGELFGLGVQMVCINYQGKCKKKTDMCPDPVHMKFEQSTKCKCDRKYAANLEKVFNDWGFDGYLPSISHPSYSEFVKANGNKALNTIKPLA